jgi:hypothetical protein
VVQTWATAGQRFVIQGCHRSGKAKTLPVAITFSDSSRPKADTGIPQTLRVPVSGSQELARLEATGVDVTHSVMAGSVDVNVSGAKQIAAIKNAGFKFKVLNANLLKAEADEARKTARYAASDTPSPLPSGRKEYRQLDDYQIELKRLIEQSGSIARAVELPKKSFQGRPLMGVELSENVNAKDDGKPTYFVMGVHHAREWPAGEIAMEFAWHIANHYADDGQIQSLLRRERIVIVPIINPDGYVVSRGAFSPYDESGRADDNIGTVEAVAGGGYGAYRRKNCDGAVPSGQFPCELQWGVDPNRNYGEGWGGAGAASVPYTQTFRGMGPWSEPETQAVHEYSQQHQVTALITLHNFASLILRPPGLAAKGKAIDEDRMKQLGDAMAADTGYTSQYSWQLYDTSGTTEDWNYAAAGTYGYTIELGPASWQGGQFHIEYEKAVVDQWIGRKSRAGKGMRAALTTMAEAAANPADHAIITGNAPAGSVLRVKRTFETETGSSGKECGISDPTDVTRMCPEQGQRPNQKVPDFVESTLVVPPSGTYEWHVGPSTRPFVFGTRFPSKDVQPGRTEKINGQAAPQGEYTDHPFNITEADNARKLTIDLTWTGQVQDIDMEVFRQTGDPDEPQQVGSSGKPPGQFEQVILENPEVGDYFVRVVNYAAAPATPFELTIARQTAGPDQITFSGKTEAWTLTCESPDGKVQDTRQVTVWRGEVATENFSCGQPAPAVQGVQEKPKPKVKKCATAKTKKRSTSKRRHSTKRRAATSKKRPAARKCAAAKRKKTSQRKARKR